MPDNAAIRVDPWFRVIFNEFERKHHKREPSEGKRGEDLFRLILSGIKDVYDVSAVIAGGAVRDTAAGISDHKDVDVFIPMKWADFAKKVDELGWAERPRVLKSKLPAYGKKKEHGVDASARAEAYVQGVEVDLVFVRTPLTPKDVQKFPIHAQRCAFTLEDGMQVSPEAAEDIKNKQFTIDPTIVDADFLEQLRDKVKGWLKRRDYKKWKMKSDGSTDWWAEDYDEPADATNTTTTYGTLSTGSGLVELHREMQRQQMEMMVRVYGDGRREIL